VPSSLTFAPRGEKYDQITGANVAVGIDFRECSFPFDNGWMVETVRLLDGLASSVVASAALRLPIGCDMRVEGSRQRVDPWNMVQPRDPAPISKVPYDLIGRVRSNVDGVIGCYQPHARVEVALNESWESLC